VQVIVQVAPRGLCVLSSEGVQVLAGGDQFVNNEFFRCRVRAHRAYKTIYKYYIDDFSFAHKWLIFSRLRLIKQKNISVKPHPYFSQTAPLLVDLQV
jgi:hypothetical protein